ncbi:MAG: cobaltochelatase CobT-related protein [Blautia sp.]|jgi:hypothetical protein
MDECKLLEDYQLELENRIKNLLWTVSGDYSLNMKPDVQTFLRSKEIALYDGIKQGAFAKYYDRNALGLYLVKKVYCHGEETSLVQVASLCMEEAIGHRLAKERPGVAGIRKKAFEDILDQEFEGLVHVPFGRLKVALLKKNISGEYTAEQRLKRQMDLAESARDAKDTMELIRIIDELYNTVVDPKFEEKYGDLDHVLAVTIEELTEYSWEDYLSEEMYEEALEAYMEKMTADVSRMEDQEVTKEMDEDRRSRQKITVVTPEALEKAYSYVELNYGKTYLSPAEEKSMNYLMCREIHADCSLFFTEGILKHPVKRNYQYEYAKRLKDKNLFLYYEKHRVVKRNIAHLTEILKKSIVLRNETVEVLSDRGQIIPSRLWRVGRTEDPYLFSREQKGDSTDFVVDVLIDASGSQRCRQGDVALQAYIISEALSNVNIPFRVMSFCTFWDYTVLHRFREYDDDRSENANIFEYITSSNNRDGLAVKAAGHGLLQREEEKKILILLSDGRPYDVVVNRPGAKNPTPYRGKYAVRDTGFEVRRLRNEGVSVLGVFAGEEQDLDTEKKIFGKDFAYIRNIENFSKIVGRYLTKQLETNV